MLKVTDEIIFILNLIVNDGKWEAFKVLPKYQPKRGGDLGWGKLFRFKCGIKNSLQIANVDLANV